MRNSFFQRWQVIMGLLCRDFLEAEVVVESKMACIGMIMINNWNQEEIDGNSQILNHCFPTIQKQ